MVQINNVSFQYGHEKILDNINLHIAKGDYIAFIGPNGGGKTTLIKIILGILKPTSGTIKIATNKIGYVPQYTNFSLDIPITVLDVVLQGRLTKNKFFYCKNDIKKAIEKMELLQIANLQSKKISDLSGGQRQKVLIARALVDEPELLILDEPTSAIDTKSQRAIYAILKQLDITKIIISHDMNVLLEGVNKVAYISQTLVLHDTPHLHFQPDQEHFCEIEFINAIKNCNICKGDT
ncbi:MAG: metal ABC transporter ATP-binding protein [Epsilonproteobacteria bacterium]|nr:metal ABC transporter ATP-binding protein [Campylobacterota bacterium]